MEGQTATGSPAESRAAVEEPSEREAALRDILQAISQNRADAAPVFQIILENAARLCAAPFSLLLIRNEADTHLELVACNSAESAFIEFIRDNPHDLTDDGSLAVQTLKRCQTTNVDDLAALPDRAPSRQLQVAADVEQMRSLMIVPLLRDGRAEGVICLYKLEVAPFSEDEARLVETFAEQAVIAIDNVRQFRELQTRFDREIATREILQVISRSRDDERPVFDAILKCASRLCDVPLGFLSICDEARSQVTIPAYLGVRPEFADILDDFLEPLEGSPLIASRIIAEGEVILSDDIGNDPRYEAHHIRRSQMVDVGGVKSVLAVPLISDGQAIGGIVLYRREIAPFSEDDVALVKSFADQAVIAIDNVKQFRAVQARTAEVQALNETLETRVKDQVGELERLGRLKRFLSPQVADAVVSAGDESMLSSHRALIATLFCDIRGFTAFCETAEPEETIEVLQTYHEEMGKLLNEHGAGVDHRLGDGLMVIFNDPLPCDDPAGDALRLGLAMRARMDELAAQWRKLGHRLGFGVGISLGYATVGMVGSEGRYEYTANGTTVNLAARLCDQAEDGEILLSPRAYSAVEDIAEAETRGEYDLKGIKVPVEIFRVTGLKQQG